MKIVEKLKQSVNSVFFPDKDVCIFCGAEKGVVHFACEACEEEIARLRMRPALGSIGFIPFIAVYHYDGKVKKPIYDLKYHNARWKAKYMAQEIYEALQENRFAYDVITFVPMFAEKERQRGYNQAQELAKEIALLANKPCETLLQKVKDTPTQTKLTGAQRKANVAGVFAPKGVLTYENVLLVDDVITTGATVSECAKILRRMGAKTVRVASYAKD